MDVTAVYYTNNRENRVLVARLQERLLRVLGDIPLVSVSKRPMLFGHNICVGNVEGGDSSHNAYRQLQIGAKEATTKFICPVEADMLYPREYFEFEPERDDVFYLADPVWVLFHQRGYAKQFAHKHRGTEAAMMVGREILIDRIEQILHGYGTWGPHSANGQTIDYMLDRRKTTRGIYKLQTPVITFKTDRNMHKKTPHNPETRTRHLEPFGFSNDFIKEFTT